MTTKTILIVEDDRPLQDNLQVYLTARNFRILQAGTVDEAASILQKEIPNLILLDLLLPGKYGTVLLEFLKGKESPIPVIVITNTDSAGRREECMQLGARNFIIKSNTSLQELSQLIIEYCDSTAGTKRDGKLRYRRRKRSGSFPNCSFGDVCESIGPKHSGGQCCKKFE